MSDCEKCAASEIVQELAIRLLEASSADLRERGMLARHSEVAFAIAEAVQAMETIAKALGAVKS